MMMRATWRLRIGKCEAMALRFPNGGRTYDTIRHAVRFWGYDSAMESSFFVTDDALNEFSPL